MFDERIRAVNMRAGMHVYSVQQTLLIFLVLMPRLFPNISAHQMSVFALGIVVVGMVYFLFYRNKYGAADIEREEYYAQRKDTSLRRLITTAALKSIGGIAVIGLLTYYGDGSIAGFVTYSVIIAGYQIIIAGTMIWNKYAKPPSLKKAEKIGNV